MDDSNLDRELERQKYEDPPAVANLAAQLFIRNIDALEALASGCSIGPDWAKSCAFEAWKIARVFWDIRNARFAKEDND